MSRAEVTNVLGQRSRSSPEHSYNTRYDRDSVVPSDEHAAIVVADIKDERKQTARQHDVATKRVSVDIPDSTYKYSTPSNHTSGTLKYQTHEQSVSGCDCNPTINNKNDNNGRKKSGIANLFRYLELEALPDEVVGILFCFLLFIHAHLIILIADADAYTPITLLGAGVMLIVACAILYIISYYIRRFTEVTLTQARTHNLQLPKP